MTSDETNRLYRLVFVLILTLAVCGAFLFLIQTFLIDIFLAAIFAGLLTPLFDKLLPLFGHRKGAAAAVVLIGALVTLALPFAAVMTIVLSEAIQVSGSTVLWIQKTIAHPESALSLLPRSLVATKEFHTMVTSFSAHVGDVVAALSGFVTGSLTFVLRGVGRFFLDLFVMSFAIVYFLQHGPALTRQLIERIPVARNEAHAIVDRTLCITAATLRGVIVGGLVDGVLVGIGFALTGIGEPWFWGAVTVVATQTPVLGCAIVWIPAAGYLLLTGHVLAAIALALWGTFINTVIDNFLRVYIVGRGASIPGFLVLVSTLGGIVVFGAVGVLIGPVLTGIAIAMLDLYYAVLKSSGLSTAAE